MKKLMVFLVLLSLPLEKASANAWEKHYSSWVDEQGYIKSAEEPEKVTSSGSAESDLDKMYRDGFIPIGISSFESGNSKTRDAERWAKKIGASHLVVVTNLESSKSTSIPLTMPSTTTSNTTGNASVFGNGGSAQGTFNSTTTTQGSKTTYIPITKNRYTKFAVFFAQEPKFGAGVYSRGLSEAEQRRLETRFAFAVRFVRDFSPAYYADILPGDIILKINGKPAEQQVWWNEILDDKEDTLQIDRGGKSRTLKLQVPLEWRRLPDSESKGEEAN